MLKKIEKIIRESAFDKKKKKARFKFNPGLALTRVRTWMTTNQKRHLSNQLFIM